MGKKLLSLEPQPETARWLTVGRTGKSARGHEPAGG